MDFKTELEYILHRYIPNNWSKEQYDSIVKLLIVKLMECHEKYK